MVKTEDALGVLNLIEKKDGIVTPQAVVDAASGIDSPIHDCFDWDDTQAAKKYRRQQARQLIRAVQVEFMGKKTDGFYNVKIEVSGEVKQGYMNVERISDDKDLKMQVQQNALRELRFWENKYAEIQELSGVLNQEAVAELEEITVAKE